MHVQLANLIKRVHCILDGFVDNEEEVLARLTEIICTPAVLVQEWEELMAGVGSKLPQKAREKLEELKPIERRTTSRSARSVQGLLDAFASVGRRGDGDGVHAGRRPPLYDLATRFRNGLIDNATGIVRSVHRALYRRGEALPRRQVRAARRVQPEQCAHGDAGGGAAGRALALRSSSARCP